MNHCLIEVSVQKAPTTRYTQDSKTPIAEMEVMFSGLRPEDGESQLKAVGWGNIASQLQNNVHAGQKLLLEGRLRMNTFTRQDGTKEKQAELTISKFHHMQSDSPNIPLNDQNSPKEIANSNNGSMTGEPANWNSSPLIPDTDEIPF